MNKKILLAVLALCLTLALCACGGTGDNATTLQPEATESTTTTTEATTTTTTAPAIPTPEEGQVLYAVKIVDAAGNPVEGAHIGTRIGTPWLLKEGTSAVVMRFESGAIGYHGATWGARGTRLGYDFQIQTEKGMLEYDHYSGEIRLYDQDGEHQPAGTLPQQKYSILWTRDEQIGKQTQHEIRHFTECVLEGKTPMTDGRSALRSLRVIWALYNAEHNHMLADLRGI